MCDKYRIRKRPNVVKHIDFGDCVPGRKDVNSVQSIINMKIMAASLAKEAALSPVSPERIAEILAGKGFSVTSDDVVKILCGQSVPTMELFMAISECVRKRL